MYFFIHEIYLFLFQAALPPQPQQQLPVANVIPNNVKLPSEPLPPTAIKSNPPTPVAQGQPTQVTAQLIQTPQGPRIVLQGIQGANLSKDQLQSIQQQVKDQLLKAQAEAKSQGKIPPTKIAIQLPPMTPAGQALTSPPLAALPQQPQQIIANKTQVPTVVSSTKPITVNQVQTVTQSKSLLYFQNHFPKIQK